MELTCGMWIPAGSLTRAEAVVEEMIRAVALPGHGNNGKGCFDIETRDLRPLGGAVYEVSAGLYCVFEPWERDEDVEQEVEVAFGFRPEPGSYAIGSDDENDDANRMLAEFAAYLAEQVGGVVEFRCPPHDLAGLPGRTRCLGPDASGGPVSQVLLDAEAMRAWSRSPRCRMYRYD
jgi:hypothetical protein